MNQAEAVLYAHTTEAASLEYLAREGFGSPVSRVVIPTEVGREIVGWCLDYYFASGRKVAPSKEAILTSWGDQMEAVGVEIEDDTETDTVAWAVETLRDEYARWQTESLIKEIAKEVAAADPGRKVDAVLSSAGRFYSLGQSLVSRRQESLAGSLLDDALTRHAEIAASGQTTKGLTFGLPEIDEHLYGVHPGEMAMLVAYSGGGKSWMALMAMLAEWRRGRRSVLFTLENDLPMTGDRLACLQAHVSYADWQRGMTDDVGLKRVMEFKGAYEASTCQPIVIMPQPGEADPVSLLRKARMLGADSVIIDQLSHIEAVPGQRAHARHEVVGAIARTLSMEIIGEDPIPLVVMHQINKEGAQSARKTGRYELEHLADSSEAFKAAKHVHAIYQSDTMKGGSVAQWQTLKFTRGISKDFDLHWNLGTGDIRVIGEARREMAG
jgi:hypothetical protein